MPAITADAKEPITYFLYTYICLKHFILKTLTGNKQKSEQYLGTIDRLDFLLEATKMVNPTLRNVATVAKIIYEYKYFETKSQLNKMPGEMQYLTFNFILDYLQKTNKIQLNPDGSIVWIETKSQLNKMPGEMQYLTFNFILDYLQKTNKIQLNPDGSIVWIYPTSQKQKKMVEQAIPL